MVQAMPLDDEKLNEMLTQPVKYVVELINDASKPNTPLTYDGDDDSVTISTKQTTNNGNYTIHFNKIMEMLNKANIEQKDVMNVRLAVAQYIDARVCHAMLTTLKSAEIQGCIDNDVQLSPHPTNTNPDEKAYGVYKMIELFFNHLIDREKTRKKGALQTVGATFKGWLNNESNIEEALKAKKNAHLENISKLMKASEVTEQARTNPTQTPAQGTEQARTNPAQGTEQARTNPAQTPARAAEQARTNPAQAAAAEQANAQGQATAQTVTGGKAKGKAQKKR